MVLQHIAKLNSQKRIILGSQSPRRKELLQGLVGGLSSALLWFQWGNVVRCLQGVFAPGGLDVVNCLIWHCRHCIAYPSCQRTVNRYRPLHWITFDFKRAWRLRPQAMPLFRKWKSDKRMLLLKALCLRHPFLAVQGLTIQCIASTFEEQLNKSSFKTAALYAIETATHKAIEVALRCAAEVRPPQACKLLNLVGGRRPSCAKRGSSLFLVSLPNKLPPLSFKLPQL